MRKLWNSFCAWCDDTVLAFWLFVCDARQKMRIYPQLETTVSFDSAAVPLLPNSEQSDNGDDNRFAFLGQPSTNKRNNASNAVDTLANQSAFTPADSLPQQNQLQKNAPPSTRANQVRLRDVLPNPKAVAGRRISMDTPFDSYTNGFEIFAQFSKSQQLVAQALRSDFDANNFANINLADLAEVLADVSPEVSSALWYYLLMCNSGFEVKAYKLGTAEIDTKGQKILDEIRNKLARYNGAENVFYDKLFMAMFLRGGMFAELILDDNGKDFVDIATPDPKTLKFKRRKDEKRGVVWDFGQNQNGQFVSLDIETARYVPVHPFPAKLEGRPLVSASFFLCIFLMAVLRDFKRVIQQQGYLRLDLEVDFEAIRAAMPEDIQNNAEEFKEWCDSVVEEVNVFYSQLEPDDAYVHSSAVKVNSPVGTANASSLQGMDALFKALERMAARSLKTMPLMMGNAEGSSEANANRQFEFYQKGIETIQRLVESGISYLYELALQARGVLCKVELRFAQIRASEALRDAQIDFMKAKLARYLYDCGYISQDEAATFAINKETADTPEPRTAGNAATDGIMQLNPDASATRFAELSKFFRESGIDSDANGKPPLRVPTVSQLNNAIDLWKEVAPDAAKNLINATKQE